MKGAIRATLVMAVLAFAAIGLPEAIAQQSTTVANPTGQSVQEQQLLDALGKLTGITQAPGVQTGVLQQPQGRTYQSFHEGALPWIGGIAILGMIALIAAFFFYRGRVRMAPDERTGHRVQRFTSLERFTHWLTASAFIVLAITGLNYVFGKRLLMPLLGPDAFASWSQWAKYGHNFFAWPFMLGVLLMIVLWIRDNLPDRYDWPWLKAGGGLVGRARPIAGRFNAGQKLVFWSVAIFGIVLAASGIVLLFPFVWLDVNGMQLTQYVHATVAMVMIAVIIAHIYIGTLGMEGAYEAMWSGEIDIGWARHHHQAWIDDLTGRHPASPVGRRSAAPAE